MIIRQLMVAVVIGLTIACASKTNNELTSDSSQQIEDFSSFFKKFGSDSVFQKERIKFPIKFSYYEEELTSDEINDQDWHFINFLDDTLAASSNEDAYTISFNKKSDNEMEYIRSGIDNGINVTYTFKTERLNWHLVSIFDKSN